MGEVHGQKSDQSGRSERGPVIRLHRAGERVLLDVVSDGRSSSPVTLEAGSMRRILASLRHEPPTAAELESAIERVENDLMPVLRTLPERSRLITSWPDIREIARVAGLDLTSDARLDTATVERLFNNLADVAYGTPAAQLGVPTNRGFAATLIVLREVLHHGGFESIIVTPSAAPGQTLMPSCAGPAAGCAPGPRAAGAPASAGPSRTPGPAEGPRCGAPGSPCRCRT